MGIWILKRVWVTMESIFHSAIRKEARSSIQRRIFTDKKKCCKKQKIINIDLDKFNN